MMCPIQVSYRIGEDGSVGVIYDGRATPTTTSDSCDVDPVQHRLTPSPDATQMDDRLTQSSVNYQYLSSVIEARAS